MSLFDAFKPKWQNSNPAKRLEAIAELDENSNQDTIEKIAISDSDVSVRTAAVKKLFVIEALQGISKNDTDDNIRRLAATRYLNEVVKKLKNEVNPTAEDLALVEQLKDTHYAEDLLKSPLTSAAVRMALVNHCNKSSILAMVANGDASEEIALAAAEKVTSETLMQELTKKSKHNTVRKLISDKIRAKRDAEDDGKKAAILLQSKREALIGQAHYLAAQKNPLDVKAQFDELMDDAAKLGMGEFQPTLNTVYESFRKFCDEANAEKIAAQKAAAEQESLVQKLTAELEELEQIISEGSANENSDRIEAIVSSWTEGKSKMQANLIKRFNNAFFKVQEFKKAPVDDETSSGDEANESARPELLERLKALADTDINETTGKHLHAIVREWEKLPLLEGEDPSMQSYNSLRSLLNEKISAFNEANQKVIEENSAKLQAIIEKVKAIDENEDFREINKKVRECYTQWKEIVGEQKFKYHDLWQEYKAATSRFQEMQQWQNWHNEKDRDDLLVEMDALVNEEPSQAVLAKLRELSNRWKEIGPISASKLQEYRDHFQSNYEKIKEKCAPFIEEMNSERLKNLAEKESICQKIEDLVANAEIFWKDKYKSVQELQENWKSIGMVPKENVATITERFKAAVNAFYAQHKENLKQEDESREKNYEKKVALCVEAEALTESNDWNATSNKLKQLQDTWKATGPVPKSKSEEIWARFRKACDGFFEKKRAHFEELDAGKQKSLEAKIQLCEKLEANAASLTLDELKSAEAEFKSLGMVPKDAVESINERFNIIHTQIIIRLSESDPTLAEALKAIKEKKEQMIEKIREFCGSAGSNQLADAVRETQKEWREIGSCGASEQELYKSFREACDEFFTCRRDQLDIQEQARQNNLQKKLLLCEQAEDLLNDLSDATVGASMNKVKHLRRLWKEVGAVPREHSEKTWTRFNTACDKVFAFGRKDAPAEQTESASNAPEA